MIITFITTKAFELSSGSEVRNYYFLKSILESSFVSKVNIIYVPLGNTSRIESPIKSEKSTFTTLWLSKRSFWSSIKSYLSGKIPYVEHLRDNDLAQSVVDISKHSQIVLLSELDAYFVAEHGLSQLQSKTKIVLDCHNIDFTRFSSEINSSSLYKRILGNHLKDILKKIEIEAFRSVDQILCCSLVDKTYIDKFKSGKDVFVIPNGVTISPTTKIEKKTEKKNIFFMGNLSYPPNVDALRYFFFKIRPLLKKRKSNNAYTIIGKGATSWIETFSKNDKDIHLEGFVHSTAKFLNSADICICPVRSGSGTRLKILEYMAAMKPIVSTTIGAEGIEVQNEREILLADTPADFAKKIDLLIDNTMLANSLAKNAYSLAVTRYNWTNIGKKLISILKNGGDT